MQPSSLARRESISHRKDESQRKDRSTTNHVTSPPTKRLQASRHQSPLKKMAASQPCTQKRQFLPQLLTKSNRKNFFKKRKAWKMAADNEGSKKQIFLYRNWQDESWPPQEDSIWRHSNGERGRMGKGKKNSEKESRNAKLYIYITLKFYQWFKHLQTLNTISSGKASSCQKPCWFNENTMGWWWGEEGG